MKRAMLKTADMELLRGCFLFRECPDELISTALDDELCEVSDFERGEVIFDTREFRRSIGVILSGTVEAAKVAGEHRYIMKLLTAGSPFGAAAVFGSDDDYVTVLTASSACRIVFFPQELLERLMQSSFRITENYIRFLSARIRFLNAKIQSLILTSADQAVVQYLVSHLSQREDGLWVRSECSISALAKMLNIGRASLYRSFDTLETLGLIRKVGKDIEILDADGLINYSIY